MKVVKLSLLEKCDTLIIGGGMALMARKYYGQKTLLRTIDILLEVP